jgi:hypothetical protein
MLWPTAGFSVFLRVVLIRKRLSCCSTILISGASSVNQAAPAIQQAAFGREKDWITGNSMVLRDASL